MNDLSNYGLTAKLMAELARVNPSTISRFIHNRNFFPLEGSSRRNARYKLVDSRHILSDLIANKILISDNNKVHSFYNFKGGTGKTSISYQVSTHLAICGYKVLVIDADAQSHLTISFGLIDNYNLRTLYDSVVNNIAVEELIIPVFDGLDIIPSNLSLSKIEFHLREKPRNENFITRIMEGLKDKYDFIIFDTNPAISLLNRNMLIFSNNVNIVCGTDPYSVHGMQMVLSDMYEFYEAMEMKLPSILIIPNKYEDKFTTSAQAMSVLATNYSEYLQPNFAIRKCEDFLKSARDGLPLAYFCKINSIAFEDIKDLIHIILDNCKKNKS